MNFSPFGNNFPTSLPHIHQFAAKLSQDNIVATSSNNNVSSNHQDVNLRYPINFNQHNSTNEQQIKYINSYVNQHQSEIYATNLGRNNENKKNLFENHHELVQEIYSVLQDEKNTNQKQVKLENVRQHSSSQIQQNPSTPPMSTSWPSGSTVADYLSHLPTSTLPLSLHHFLKYSESIKKESLNQIQDINSMQQQTNSVQVKKKKKKKNDKEKKPRLKPGEIRLTTALDGSTLYCCPECHMAYPEKELLEQHLLGHTLERRFVCDICGAGLKRKDHLTRHKQSHNPERPYVCTVCLKAFKRKEQLTLHFVIHSGEKRHICTECGKGFYRKDHLRKHTRSHIARRVKAELSQQHSGNGNIPQNSVIQNHVIH